ncbi:MAG: 3'-5' exonuclease [Bacteriovorax sp.]|nr:3'-5' exonuclease [Bacteriovorax sp.]
MIKTQSAIEMDLTESEKEKLWEFFPNGIISIDLETTGLSPLVDRIIEVGALKITPTGSHIFQTLINPEIPIPPHTIAIHNISDEMVKDSPTLVEVLHDLREFMADMPIIAHNAKFDMGFIVLGMQRAKLGLSANDIYCSCKLARQTHMEIGNHKLSTLVKELNIPLLNHHRATDDAFAALKIFMCSLHVIKTPQSPMLKRYGHLFSLNEFEKLNSEELPEKLSELENLVKEAAVIEINYSGGNHKNEWRPVKLTSLLNTPEGNILYARCLWSDIQKSFKLKKITELRKPSAEDIQKWLKKS